MLNVSESYSLTIHSPDPLTYDILYMNLKNEDESRNKSKYPQSEDEFNITKMKE